MLLREWLHSEPHGQISLGSAVSGQRSAVSMLSGSQRVGCTQGGQQGPYMGGQDQYNRVLGQYM